MARPPATTVVTRPSSSPSGSIRTQLVCAVSCSILRRSHTAGRRYRQDVAHSEECQCGAWPERATPRRGLLPTPPTGSGVGRVIGRLILDRRPTGVENCGGPVESTRRRYQSYELRVRSHGDRLVV